MGTSDATDGPAGPFADDLDVGRPLPAAPDITIDGGVAALYQAISGDGLALALSQPLSRAVTGHPERMVNPALVMQVAIGQSTVATRHVVANLFYRDVVLHRQVHVGETLRSVVTPLCVEAASSRPDRPSRAKVLLGIHTESDGAGLVLDFQRAALLPVRNVSRLREIGRVGTADADATLERFLAAVPSRWDLSAIDPQPQLPVGASREDPLPDVVSSALELVRLTRNEAIVHRDASATLHDRRLVYGGHPVALAQASVLRICPSVVTVLGWRSCDHLAPVFEGDSLRFTVMVEDRRRAGHGASVTGLRVTVDAERAGERVPVLAWRPVVLEVGSPTGGA